MRADHVDVDVEYICECIISRARRKLDKNRSDTSFGLYRETTSHMEANVQRDIWL
jgi:hypothetical protein